jgi:hypothetical protein
MEYLYSDPNKIRHMKKSYFFLILSISLVNLLGPTAMFAQQETFDLATFSAPKGWKKGASENAVQFTKEETAKGTYCAITLFRSVPGSTNAKNNFDAAWGTIVKETVPVSVAPTMQPAVAEDGWEVQSGYASFESDGAKGVVVLVTSSGFEKMVNAMILTNTDVYEKNISDFLGSISLKKPEVTNLQPATGNNANASVVGTWGISTTVASYYNVHLNEGSIITQYTFKANGTYSFYIKTFRYQLDKLLLTRETGSYQISGNTITVVPQKSVVESWTRKDGTDNWGKLLTSQKKELEKTTYQFYTKDFGSGMVLVLQAGKATKRDGAFNNSDKDAWFYPSKSAVEFIKLPGGEEKITQTINENAPQKATGGYTYATTNFDDGWVATDQPDWVQVNKGITRVLIHYPNKKADAYNSVVLDGLKNAWNILVAPKYSTISNLLFRPVGGWQTIEFAEADAVEKTGKPVYVVLFKMNYSNGSGKYLEFITPDKSSFEQEFGAYHANTYGWEKMESMANYNKFAIAASDLKGKWSSDFSGAIQYVNANTGLDAGMDTHASAEDFQLGPGNNYKWDLGVASGAVGNIKFQSVKSSGAFSVSGTWKINFSDIGGKPRAYDAYFSCIKGLRILWLDNRPFAKVE